MYGKLKNQPNKDAIEIMKKANEEINAICEKYNVHLEPKPQFDIVMNQPASQPIVDIKDFKKKDGDSETEKSSS